MAKSKRRSKFSKSIRRPRPLMDLPRMPPHRAPPPEIPTTESPADIGAVDMLHPANQTYGIVATVIGGTPHVSIDLERKTVVVSVGGSMFEYTASAAMKLVATLMDAVADIS